MRFDAREVRELSRDLAKVASKAVPEAAKVVSKGALNIKNEMASEAESSGHYKHFSRSISYDLRRGGLEAEIGPDKGRTQGALGNILYFGTSKNGPVLNINGPLDSEAPRFEKALGDITDGIL